MSYRSERYSREDPARDRMQGVYHYLGTRRRRVDWESEIKKTERIGRRSLVITGLCFALTLAVMIGVNKMGIDIDLPRRVLSVVCIILACFVLRFTFKHRAKVLRERQERELQRAQSNKAAFAEQVEVISSASAVDHDKVQ